MRLRNLIAAALSIAAMADAAERRYPAAGMILSVDPMQRTVTISHDSIPGLMDAMVMPFRVRPPRELENLKPATLVTFTLVVGDKSSYISDVHLRAFDSVEKDPDQARRLQALDAAVKARQGAPPALKIGDKAPDFSLIDQHNQPVSLSQFRGKVVAITFIYTRCPLPDYCVRLTNNFGRLQNRFRDRLGKDLILLSVTFDPEHDRPEVLARYAEVWKADSAAWRFLTGSLSDVKNVCAFFGVNFWPDEGVLTHSLHTVLIDRQGRLKANLEGNQFSAAQLGDLVDTAIRMR